MQLIDSGLVGSTDFSVGRGSARAEDAQGTPNQSHISPSIISMQRLLALMQSHGCTGIAPEDACYFPAVETALSLVQVSKPEPGTLNPEETLH